MTRGSNGSPWPFGPVGQLLAQKYAMLYQSNIFLKSSYMGLSEKKICIARDKDNFNFSNITIENRNRIYKVTQLDPMNSNIAILLYECRENNLVSYKLRAFLNENLVKIDGCKSENICELDEFLSYYENFKNSCVSTRNVCKI